MFLPNVRLSVEGSVSPVNTSGVTSTCSTSSQRVTSPHPARAAGGGLGRPHRAAGAAGGQPRPHARPCPPPFPPKRGRPGANRPPSLPAPARGGGGTPPPADGTVRPEHRSSGLHV